jgi:hypothetical protein
MAQTPEQAVSTGCFFEEKRNETNEEKRNETNEEKRNEYN